MFTLLALLAAGLAHAADPLATYEKDRLVRQTFDTRTTGVRYVSEAVGDTVVTTGEQIVTGGQWWTVTRGETTLDGWGLAEAAGDSKRLSELHAEKAKTRRTAIRALGIGGAMLASGAVLYKANEESVIGGGLALGGTIGLALGVVGAGNVGDVGSAPGRVYSEAEVDALIRAHNQALAQDLGLPESATASFPDRLDHKGTD
jgi:hypothetical protein